MIPDRAPVVIVEARSVYGSMLYYPSNEAAEILARFAGRRTFTPEHLVMLVRVGCTVNIQGDQRAQLTAARLAEFEAITP